MTAPCDGTSPGCACHGWPVVVWVTGVPTQEAAEALVERLLSAASDAAVVRG